MLIGIERLDKGPKDYTLRRAHSKITVKPLTIILDDSHIDSHVDLDTEGGFLPYMLRTNFVLVSFLYLTRLMYLKYC